MGNALILQGRALLLLNWQQAIIFTKACLSGKNYAIAHTCGHPSH
jgi:hypothetical protein